MNESNKKDTSRKIITVPNCLTVLRILLIPVFLWAALVLKNRGLSLGVLAFSFFTDVLDGFIARRYHVTTDFGKAMDPIADKLNQTAIMAVLVAYYPIVLLPLGILVVKELYLGILMYIVYRRSGKIFQAEWHGKITTFLIYLTMGLHLIWINDMPPHWSYITVGITVFFQLLSLVLYAIRNTQLVKQYKNGPFPEKEEGPAGDGEKRP